MTDHLSDADLSRRATKLATWTAGPIVLVACIVLAVQTQLAYRDAQIEQFRSELIIASSPSAIIMCDEDGTIIDLNFSAEKMFGWQRRFLIGQDTTVLVPEQYRAGHTAGMRAAAARAKRLEPGNNWMVSKAELKVEALTRDNTLLPLTADIRVIKLSDGSIQFITYLREQDGANRDTIIPLPSLKGQAAWMQRPVRAEQSLVRNDK